MNNLFLNFSISSIIFFSIILQVSAQSDTIPSIQSESSFSTQSRKCVPVCRKGYLCVDGECVSACNPPCGPDDWCNPVTLECVPKSEFNNSSSEPIQQKTVIQKSSTPAQTTTKQKPYVSSIPNPLLNIKPFNRGYFEISPPIGFGIYGNFTYKYEYNDTSSSNDSKYGIKGDGAMSGIRLAAYGAVTENAHIGIFFMHRSGEIYYKHEDSNNWGNRSDDISINSFGLAMKFGSMIANRVWFGFGLDIGLNFLETEDMEDDDEDKLIGCETFARFCTDIFILNFNGFKLSVPISLGAVITPVSGRELYEGDNYKVRGSSFNISPVLTIGIALGA